MNDAFSLEAIEPYDFVAPRQIVFGWGRRREAGTLARQLGTRARIVCGAKRLLENGTVDQLQSDLRAAGVEAELLDTIEHEPEVNDVDRFSAQLRGNGVRPGDLLIGLGGGAAMDLAKAVAAMATNDESPMVQDYLEGVGRDLKPRNAPLSVLAMPTTAGTGAEATRNAVISSFAPPFKKSLRDTRIMPQIALVDPELTVSVPPDVTAASGMDAITQLIESYISLKAKPIPQALALQGLQNTGTAIVEAVENPTSRPAREAMAHAALLSGMALANSGLGLAHGVAAALGIHCRVAHGVACALMLPVALKVNAEVREAELAALAMRWKKISTAMNPHPQPLSHKWERGALVATFIDEIEQLCDRLKLPRRLSQVGVTRGQLPAIVTSSRGSSMSGNPRQLTDDELLAVLEDVL